MILKNFVTYAPKVKKYGDHTVYLISDDGEDWYDSQSKFAPNTLKVMYDADGLILSSSRDVSTLYPEGANVAEFDVNIDDARGMYVINDDLVMVPRPTEYHIWSGNAWISSDADNLKIRDEIIVKIRNAINTKRDACVDGGVYVNELDVWVDTDAIGRATLVEIKSDFDLNGTDSFYTLICADNSIRIISFNDFKHIWDAVKKLKEQMYENAYMHKILLDQSPDPVNYDWSIGWSKTYEDFLAEQIND